MALHHSDANLSSAASQSQKWQLIGWHELMIPRRIMRPSIACNGEQLDARCSTTDIPPPQSATLGLHPVSRKLLPISRPAEDRRLSWPEHTV